ncbi:MAG: cation:dicarboxylase symporter family transporter [Sphingobium sp.]
MRKALFILASLFAGLLIGIAAKGAAPVWREAADSIGTMWLNGLRMTVVPLIISLLIVGIVQTATAASAGKLAARGVALMIALLWLSSALAAILFPAIVAFFPIPTEAALALRGALSHSIVPGTVPPFSEFLKAIIPTNPVAAAADDAILPLIIFVLIFAFAVVRLPDAQRATIAGFFEATANAMIMVVHWVLWLAPLGVFALAFKLGQTAGMAAFGALAHYVAVLVAIGGALWISSFVLATLGARLNPVAFFRATIPAQAVAISTQSSLASLPAMLEGVDRLGIRRPVSEVMLPIAVALFRVTGPAMNLGVALYIAHWLGIELSAWQIALGAAAAAITTMGAVSLPGAISFIGSIAPICLVMGLPIEPLGLLIAIEAFPDIMRTLANVTMDMAVTATIDRRATKTL